MQGAGAQLLEKGLDNAQLVTLWLEHHAEKQEMQGQSLLGVGSPRIGVSVAW